MNNCFYCGQEDCSEKCNDCHNVYYCCQEHLAFHRSQDSKCFPFRVEKNQELGRYMVATADIKPFQTVLQDQALAFGPSEFNPACCLLCLQSLEDVSHVCPQCNVPLCKSEECQASATIHEPECLVFRQHQPEKLKVELDSLLPSPVYSLVVPLRLLGLRQTNPNRWKLALTLTSHLTESARPNDKCQYILATGMPLLERCGLSKDDIRLVAHLMGILWNNAVTLPRLLENLNEPLGHALFPIFSLLAHNCMSNCRYTVSKDGRFVTVRALRHIKAGEHLNIDYANPLLGHLTRRKAFFGHWQFNCRCGRCSSSTEMDTYLSAVRCPDRDGYLLPLSPLESGSAWKCDRCGKPQAEQWVEDRTEKFKEMGSKMSMAISIQEWEDYLEVLSMELHPNHWIAMNVKLIIVQLLSTREKLDSLDKIKRTLELCNNYLEVYDKVSRGYTKWRGHILELQSSAVLKQHEILSEQGQIDSANWAQGYKKSLLMMKEATKCRQYEPEDDMAMLGFLLRNHNKALASL